MVLKIRTPSMPEKVIMMNAIKPMTTPKITLTGVAAISRTATMPLMAVVLESAAVT